MSLIRSCLGVSGEERRRIRFKRSRSLDSEWEIRVSVGTATTGGSTDRITVVTDVTVVVAGVGLMKAAVTVGSVATVVVPKFHLCQRVLMSQAGGSGRCVVVTETLVVVRVLS